MWERGEIEALLAPEDAALFCRYYGVEEGGNAPEGADPHGEFAGKNTLILRERPDARTAARLAECRRVLFAAREGRPRPFLDDKIVTAWNGLMVGAFARAGSAWGDGGLIAAAERAAEGLLGKGSLARSWRGEVRGPDAFAEDYACLVSGLLDLYEATGAARWLREADRLQGEMDARFRDEDGAYFGSAAGDATVLVRIKEDHDGAEPAASSVAAENLARLAGLLDEARRLEMARETVRALGEVVERMPVALPASSMKARRKPRRLISANRNSATARSCPLSEGMRTQRSSSSIMVNASPRCAFCAALARQRQCRPATLPGRQRACRARLR